MSNLDTLLSNNTLKIVLFAIIKHAIGDKSHLWNAIVGMYNHPYDAKLSNHMLDDKSMRFTIKKVLQNDDTGQYFFVFCLRFIIRLQFE